MNALMILGLLLMTNGRPTEIKKLEEPNLSVFARQASSTAPLSILYPKNNQRVRGVYKIQGKAKPGSVVNLQVTSAYFKTANDRQERLYKGAGPINRMNRKFALKADRSGIWILKQIELINAGWEERFTIKVTSEGKALSISVIDDKHPILID